MIRIGLFLLTNIAIIVVVSIVLAILGVPNYLGAHGINYNALLIFAAVFGFTGAFISLFISKWMAKMAYRIQLIDQPKSEQERWIKTTVEGYARKMSIGMPEVGIYDSAEPNAFATGWNRNKALVAVSSSLLQHMDRDEVEGVLGHEVSHVANGDMVTLALVQGVVNTFVIFFARVAAYFVMTFFNRDDSESSNVSGSFAYYGIAILFEILFGILASMIVMWFSRFREFRADAGSARIAGKEKMIKALRKLQQMTSAPEDERATSLAAFKISRRPNKFLELFSSHPPLEKRIAALQRCQF